MGDYFGVNKKMLKQDMKVPAIKKQKQTCSSKNSIKIVKRQATRCEIFAVRVSDKRLTCIKNI